MADDDQMQDDDTPVSIPAKDLKALRNLAKQAESIQQQYADANRQLAFAKAKIDLTDPKMSYFVKGYEGDLDPEQIRAAATAAGFIGGQQQQQQVSPQEMAGHQRMAEAGLGGTPGEPDLADQIRNANSQEEVMALMIKNGYPTTWSNQ